MGWTETQYDIFRDSNLRYFGYANEVGESFRHVLSPKLVRASYGVALGYVAADTLDKGLRKLFNKVSPFGAIGSILDALIWQSLASIIIPGYTINRIVHFTRDKVIMNHKIPPQVRMYIPIAAGLVSIPIIVGPIDAAVTMFMNITTRNIFGP